jgi:hypothetical protein
MALTYLEPLRSPSKPTTRGDAYRFGATSRSMIRTVADSMRCASTWLSAFWSPFVDALVRRTREPVVWSGTEPATQVGRLVDAWMRDAVHEQAIDAVAGGRGGSSPARCPAGPAPSPPAIYPGDRCWSVAAASWKVNARRSRTTRMPGCGLEGVKHPFEVGFFRAYPAVGRLCVGCLSSTPPSPGEYAPTGEAYTTAPMPASAAASNRRTLPNCVWPARSPRVGGWGGTSRRGGPARPPPSAGDEVALREVGLDVSPRRAGLGWPPCKADQFEHR